MSCELKSCDFYTQSKARELRLWEKKKEKKVKLNVILIMIMTIESIYHIRALMRQGFVDVYLYWEKTMLHIL